MKIDVSDIIEGPKMRGTRFAWGGDPAEGYADCATLAAYTLKRAGMSDAVNEAWLSCRSSPVGQEWTDRLRAAGATESGQWDAVEWISQFDLELGDVILNETDDGGLHLSTLVDDSECLALTISESTRAMLVQVNQIERVKGVFRWKPN